MSLELGELRKAIKIRWNKFYVIKSATCYSYGNNFELTPDDFLRFAKDEYNFVDKKGLIGALSNSKRAIDCQIDWIISYLGFEYLNFNEERYPAIRVLLDKFYCEQDSNKNLPLKLKFIQAMEIAPTFLISKIRNIRNKLEHEYTLPSIEEVREAIEITELFINATENMLYTKFCTDYSIYNEYCENDYKLQENKYILSISFMLEGFFYEKPYIRLRYRENGDCKEVNVNPEDKEYIFFIKIGTTSEFSYLVDALDINIDKRFVRYEVDYS